jgi:hypothetical protein
MYQELLKLELGMMNNNQPVAKQIEQDDKSNQYSKVTDS